MARSWAVMFSYCGDGYFEVEADTLDEAYEKAELEAQYMLPANANPDSVEIEIDDEDIDDEDTDDDISDDDGDDTSDNEVD